MGKAKICCAAHELVLPLLNGSHALREWPYAAICIVSNMHGIPVTKIS
jgi:hypothetical protein